MQLLLLLFLSLSTVFVDVVDEHEDFLFDGPSGGAEACVDGRNDGGSVGGGGGGGAPIMGDDRESPFGDAESLNDCFIQNGGTGLDGGDRVGGGGGG